jgi:CheY-like chemotaxis protein
MQAGVAAGRRERREGTVAISVRQVPGARVVWIVESDCGFSIAPGEQERILVHPNVDPAASGTSTKMKDPRLKVLLVDDYPDAREMYGAYLEYSGFEVVEAGNGVEALQRAVETEPDIILMDLSLPVMDGWEATRRLKADQRTAEIPVVALTGHALVGISDGARRAGCDGFVSKPCLPEDLVKVIRKVLDLQAVSHSEEDRQNRQVPENHRPG